MYFKINWRVKPYRIETRRDLIDLPFMPFSLISFLMVGEELVLLKIHADGYTNDITVLIEMSSFNILTEISCSYEDRPIVVKIVVRTCNS